MMKLTRGFSLIELMITVLIVGVLLGIGIPSMSNLIRDIRITTEASQLMENFTLARHHAVSTTSYVSVCGSSNGSLCDGGWGSGIMAYRHNSASAEPNENEESEILYYHKASKTFSTQGNIRKFTFRPSGLLRGRSGSLLYCPNEETAQNFKRIVVSRGGRVRVYSAADLVSIHYLSEMNCT